jgi:D-glycero-alpha-D-manno-heptose 1-phosphate guanylyltransferase
VLDALILAGGFGTRLAARVPGVPKPMAPVCGKPFLELLLRGLARQGLRRAVLSLGYKAEMIQNHFGEHFGGVELAYEIETEPLGTGGAIRRSLARCQGDAALVVNGDTLLDLDLAAAVRHWQQVQRPLLLACEVPDTTRYGRVHIGPQAQLLGFAEKGMAGPGWINSGHYVLPCALFDGYALPAAFSFESDFLMPQLRQLGVLVLKSQGLFIDIGVPEDYERAQTLLQPWA